jgi:hypothetical protein
MVPEVTMTEEEDYCYGICRAARNLGILCRKNGDCFEWFDMVTVRTITGSKPDPDPKKSLYLACQELVEYFQIKEQAK